MKTKLLSFPFICFSESGLFNGLQPIQIKKSFPLLHCGSNITNRVSLSRACRRTTCDPCPISRNTFSSYSVFPQSNVQKFHGRAPVPSRGWALRSSERCRRRAPRANTIAFQGQIGEKALERTLHISSRPPTSRPPQNVSVRALGRQISGATRASLSDDSSRQYARIVSRFERNRRTGRSNMRELR